MKFGTGATAQLPSDFETAKGIQLAAQAAGPGAGGPVQIVADYGNEPVDAAQVAAVRRGRAEASRRGRGRASP